MKSFHYHKCLEPLGAMPNVATKGHPQIYVPKVNRTYDPSQFGSHDPSPDNTSARSRLSTGDNIAYSPTMNDRLENYSRAVDSKLDSEQSVSSRAQEARESSGYDRQQGAEILGEALGERSSSQERESQANAGADILGNILNRKGIKSLNPDKRRGILGEASTFFKELAYEQAFGDNHRETSKFHKESLESLLKELSNNSDDDHNQDATEQDTPLDEEALLDQAAQATFNGVGQVREKASKVPTRETWDKIAAQEEPFEDDYIPSNDRRTQAEISSYSGWLNEGRGYGEQRDNPNYPGYISPETINDTGSLLGQTRTDERF